MWAFTPFGVGAGDDSDFEDVGMGREFLFDGERGGVLFDVGGIEVSLRGGRGRKEEETWTNLAAGDDDVLASVHDRYTPIGMHNS